MNCALPWKRCEIVLHVIRSSNEQNFNALLNSKKTISYSVSWTRKQSTQRLKEVLGAGKLKMKEKRGKEEN